MCPQVLFGEPMQLGLPTVKLDFLEVSESLNQSPRVGIGDRKPTLEPGLLRLWLWPVGNVPTANISKRFRNKQQILAYSQEFLKNISIKYTFFVRSLL